MLDCCYAADMAGEHSLGEGVEEGEEEEGFRVGGGVGAFLWVVVGVCGGGGGGGSRGGGGVGGFFWGGGGGGGRGYDVV